jgi:hypothetical protein
LGVPLRVGLYAVHGTLLQSLTHFPITRRTTTMPLTARLRDEENERINNILKRLIGLDYVPQNGNEAINEALSGLGFDLDSLLDMSSEDMVQHIRKFNFDWANAEQFADFLITLSNKLPQNKLVLKEKAIAIYNYIQLESKTFSFDIFNKITAAKN